MNRILLAAVAALGFAGVAAAQDAPIFQGNFSASVQDANDRTVTTNRPAADVTGSASIAVRDQQAEPRVGGASTDANPWLSGR